jgi:hypothetical protein
MNTMTNFDSTRESLYDILTKIHKGKTQLPDFQRGWIWDDERVRKLLTSVALSYPIGAIMLLETGNIDVRFKPRFVEGVSIDNPPLPEHLILDGQQRLTSLLRATLLDEPVETTDAKKKPIKRWYYADIDKVVNSNGDIDEAIIGLPEDRMIRNFRGEVLKDYSTSEKEYQEGLFPLNRIFDPNNWRHGHNKYWGYDSEKIEQFDNFYEMFIERFKQFQIPIIILRKETPKEAVCQVFEKVNTGGVSLTVFELLTATFAADEFNLRDDWNRRKKILKEKGVLGKIENTDFLQAVSLLSTRGKRLMNIENGVPSEKAPAISCKRRDILRLTLDEYKSWADVVMRGYLGAARLLYSQKIFSDKDLPYRTQITPLAAIYAILGEEAENAGVKSKLIRWYWCGVLGELYGSAIETRFARDLAEVLDWISNDGPEPATVAEANFYPSRLHTLKTRNSAAYKGLYALLMQEGGSDFRTDETIVEQTYFDDKIDIHHIFPQAWCRKNRLEMKLCDCIINKTAVSAKTNRIIGGKAPSQYLPRLEQRAGIDELRMNQILNTHLIDPESLRADDFQEFFKAREEALLQLIEKAMGKPVVRDSTLLDEDIGVDFEDEEEGET